MNNGDVYSSNKTGDFEIIEYKGSRSVLVRFIVTGYEVIVQAGDVRNGSVLDRLSPSICGLGFIGDGEHKAVASKKITKAYSVWANMLKRCYDSDTQEKCPTYIGCTVCDEWHNFQNFAGWYEENYIQGFQIDKDIKVKGSCIYSPETCMFVSAAENMIHAHAKEYRFISPIGDVVSVYNLNMFCDKNNLNSGHMYSVNGGKLKQHKGWIKYAQ